MTTSCIDSHTVDLVGQAFTRKHRITACGTCGGPEIHSVERPAAKCGKPVYHGGKRVGFIREYSDVLLIFLLKGLRPAKYRERVEHAGRTDLDIGFTEDLMRKLDQDGSGRGRCGRRSRASRRGQQAGCPPTARDKLTP